MTLPDKPLTLGALIGFLKSLDQDLVVPRGFSGPHSYRGYYDELAFEPVYGVTVDHMLREAVGAVYRTFIGYKGGEFRMYPATPVHLAPYGDTGDPMTIELLTEMFGL